MKTRYVNWLTILLLLCAFRSQAQSPDPNLVYQIINRATGQVLEIGGGGDLTDNNHIPNLWGYFGNANQQWRFYAATARYGSGVHYEVVNINSNKMLYSGRVAAQNSQGIPTREEFRNPQFAGEMWDLNMTPNGNGALEGTITVPSSSPLLFLTGDANNQVTVSNAKNDPTQVWVLAPVSVRPQYEIVNAWSGAVLQADVNNLGVSQSFPDYSPSNFRWQFSDYDNDQNLTIINRFKQEILEVSGSNLGSNGNTANITNNSGGVNQKWVLLDINSSQPLSLAQATDGRQFKIYNRYSGKVLQIQGTNNDLYQENQPANQWNDFGRPWQRWYVRRIDVFGFGVPITDGLSGTGYSYLDPTHVYRIVHHETGLTLEIGGGGDLTQGGLKAGFWNYWGGANQQWVIRDFIYSGSNTPNYALVNRNSNLSLQAGYNTKAPGYQLGQSGYNVYDWKFKMVPTANGLQGVIFSGNVPDRFLSAGQNSDGSNNYQVILTADQSQLWDIIDVSTNPGVYKIVSRAFPSLVLTANEDRTVGLVYDYVKFDARNQWSFGAQGNGYAKIINRLGQQVLEIDNSVTYNGGPAVVRDAGNAASEYWQLLDVNDSHVLTTAEATDGRAFKIFSSNSGKVLQVSDINADGSDSNPNRYPKNVNQWNDFGKLWQQWTVQYTSANLTSSPTSTESALSTKPIASDSPASVAAAGVFTLYPNPVHDNLLLTLPGNTTPVKVRVTDVRGSVVEAHYQENGKINVSSLAAGLYLLTVSDGQREYHQKFMKE